MSRTTKKLTTDAHALQLSESIKSIYLTGDIDYTTTKDITHEIIIAQTDVTIQSINLYISSQGGYLPAAFGIWDIIKASQKPVTIIAVGFCGSAATMILQAGVKRLATENTTIFIHPSNMQVEYSKPHQEYRNISQNYEENHILFMKLSSSKSGHTPEEFEKLCTPSLYLKPQEALKLGAGLIDGIVTSYLV